jgi:hypothetical protein
LSYENGEPFVFDELPGRSPTRSLLAVCGVDGPLGEDAMPVMHNDAELDVVQVLYAELPVLDAPTSYDDSVYTGIHHDYGADESTLPDTISDNVPFPMLDF